ncbi:MAG: hypothetical protein ACI3XA_05050 [Clostridia bacterium]
MKTFKRGLLLAAVVVFALSLTACFGPKIEKSTITGTEVQEEFWNVDLDASAAKLNGYRAQSVDEVVRNWRQAKMQGNGAILYAIFSPDLKEVYLQQMKSRFGCWNFYYSPELGTTDVNSMPLEMLMGSVEEIDGEKNSYSSSVSCIMRDGSTEQYQINIGLVDGGYYVTSYTQPEVVEQ